MLAVAQSWRARQQEAKRHEMSEKTVVIEVPEVVGIFDSVKALQTTIYDLMIAGFSR